MNEFKHQVGSPEKNQKRIMGSNFYKVTLMKMEFMKIFLISLVLTAGLTASAVQFDQRQRIVKVSGTPVKAEKLEIVVQNSTKLMEFTANELQTFLTEATGQKPAIVAKPTDGATSLILGDNSYLRTNGLDVANLPTDGYYIRRNGNQIFLAGVDSTTDFPAQNKWAQIYKRGTLNAVYDFLERFADARFFFPGEMGTIIPDKGALILPPVIDILDRPDMVGRTFMHYDGKWYEDESYQGVKGINLNLLRLRMQSNIIPFGHGLSRLGYKERFGKTHPEYFALMEDGSRNIEPDMPHSGHICFNSGMREVIYQDVKAFLSGQPATVTGALAWGKCAWNVNAAAPGYFNLMPQDWFYWCSCEKCAKTAKGGRDFEKDNQAISDYMWGFTSEIANRLTQDGVKGVVTQMAYLPYDLVPKCDIPQNVAVQIAVTGPGKKNQQDDDKKIKDWVTKLNSKVSLWTYPGKFGNKAMPGIPAMMHHHIGKYFQDRKDWIYGAFLNSDTDYYLFNYLNYYIFSKGVWNNSADLDVLLADHYKAMFGEGAPMMQKFYDELEKIWIDEITSNTVDTSLGPVTTLPNDIDIWTKIYSPKRLSYFDGLFDQAEKAAASNKGALKRIKFMREKLLVPIHVPARDFQNRQNSLDSWKVSVPGKVHLRPCDGDLNEVKTVVSLSQDKDNMIFTVDCEEPRMEDIKAANKGADAPLTYEDSCVEIFLNPSGDRTNYYHIVANSNGALYDSKCKIHENPDIKWNSGANVKIEKRTDGWKAIVSVPKAALGEYNKNGFPVNFARHRSLKGEQPVEVYYQWSPVPGRSFHAIERYGSMILEGAPNTNIVKDGDFNITKNDHYSAGAWSFWQSGKESDVQLCELDEKMFISGGKSLHFKNGKGLKLNATQQLQNMKPDTKYRFSYFVKTKDLKAPGGAGAFIYFSENKGTAYPDPRVNGTHPWHKLTFDITTPPDTGKGIKPIVGIWIWDAEGEAWFDNVTIEEIR